MFRSNWTEWKPYRLFPWMEWRERFYEVCCQCFTIMERRWRQPKPVKIDISAVERVAPKFDWLDDYGRYWWPGCKAIWLAPSTAAELAAWVAKHCPDATQEICAENMDGVVYWRPSTYANAFSNSEQQRYYSNVYGHQYGSALQQAQHYSQYGNSYNQLQQALNYGSPFKKD